MLEWTLIAVIATTAPAGGGVHGTVRVEGTDEPIAGVHVSLAAGSQEVVSGDDGSYTIPPLPAGRHRLRFSRFGYHDLEIDVVVAEGRDLRLDVRLRPRPIAVPAISVRAGREAFDPGSFRLVGPLPPGSRALEFSAFDPSLLTPDADVLRSLEDVPGAEVAEESATELHFRGGSADQNLVLLDGIPVYNATHSTGVLGGVNPDAVSAVALHTGAMPARYGGRLSSAIDIAVPRPGGAGAGARGGVGPGDLRTTAETPFPGGGGLLLAGRRTTYDVVERGEYDPRVASAFDELLAKATVPVGPGEVDLLSLRASNSLSYWADPAFEDDEGGAPPPGMDPDHRYSPVRWNSHTDAVIWRWSNDDGSDGRLSAWNAASRSSGEWSSTAERLGFVHSLRHRGIRLEATRTGPDGSVLGGLSAERLTSWYAARLDGEVEASGALDADATWLAAFVEHRWIPHDRWLVDHGARVIFGAGGGADLEPRVSAHFRPRADVTLSAGFARVHQYAQSMRNEESALVSAYAFDPLVSAAHDRVPVARSDQLTASARLQLAESLRLEIDGYARRMDGLVLVAPETPQPFAIGRFAVGRGTAHGIGAALRYRGDRAEADVIAEWSRSTRSTEELSYRPAFSRTAAIAAAIARRLGESTRVRAALRAATGRPTSGLAGGFDWEPFDPFSGEVELGGTPLRRSTELNRERLPAYVRLDAGVRRTWRPGFLGADGRLDSWLEVRNLLGRRNVMALEERSDDAGWAAIPFADTFLSLGLQWAF